MGGAVMRRWVGSHASTRFPVLLDEIDLATNTAVYECICVRVHQALTATNHNQQSQQSDLLMHCVECLSRGRFYLCLLLLPLFLS